MGIVTVELFVLGSLAGLEEVGGPKFLKIPRSFFSPLLILSWQENLVFRGAILQELEKFARGTFCILL